jgi:3',5'-cyclic AMP phosphodiesterase CpdA
MFRKNWLLGLAAVILAALISWSFAKPQKQDKEKQAGDRGPVVIAHISDTHIGLKRAPDAADNLRKVARMIKERNVDAIIVTGDIAQNREGWQQAREIVEDVGKKVLWLPGNHDINQKNLDRWRSVWGKDYDEFNVKYVTIYGLNSQLLGNYDDFHAREPQPLSDKNASEAKKMLQWLAGFADDKSERKGKVIMAAQHVPNSRADGFPNDPKPYWVTHEPWRSQSLEILRRLGVKHMLVGHWHKGIVFEADGMTYHAAPSTSWTDWDDYLGFAVHTISPAGDVKTEFVRIPGADTHPTR